MLVAVFAGADRESSKLRSSLHFERFPEPGEFVEIENELQMVAQAWHTPSVCFAGPKLAILVNI